MSASIVLGARTQNVFFGNIVFKSFVLCPANKYLDFRGFKKGKISDKYQLINKECYKFDDVPYEWLEKEKHLIQRDCYDNGTEYVDKEKMQYWFSLLYRWWLSPLINYQFYNGDYRM